MLKHMVRERGLITIVRAQSRAPTPSVVLGHVQLTGPIAADFYRPSTAS